MGAPEKGPVGEGSPGEDFLSPDTPSYKAMWESIDAELALHPDGPPEWGPEWKAFLEDYRRRLAEHRAQKPDPPPGLSGEEEAPNLR